MRRHRRQSMIAVALWVALFAAGVPSAASAATVVVNTASVRWDNGDPAAGQESASATLLVLDAIEVPTLDKTGLFALALLVSAMAIGALRRRRAVR